MESIKIKYGDWNLVGDELQYRTFFCMFVSIIGCLLL